MTAVLPPASRSRAANRPLELCGVDGNTAAARRWRDLAANLAAEIGCDPDQLCASDAALIRNAAALILRGEELQAAIVRGAAVDGDEVIRVGGTTARLMAVLRKRRAAPKAPDLGRYLRNRSQIAADESAGPPGPETTPAAAKRTSDSTPTRDGASHGGTPNGGPP